jgi:pyruvate dehydrogenase E2 component (dihydrolipoamide acetyltransferase)
MQEEGYVAAILYEAGTKDIPLGKVLAILVDDEGDIAAFKDYKPEDGDAPAAASTPQAAPAEQPAAAAPTPKATPAAAPPTKPTGGRVFASPLA